MGKVIQFPKMFEEEVEDVIVPNINNYSSNSESTKVKEKIQINVKIKEHTNSKPVDEVGIDVNEYTKIKPKTIEKEALNNKKSSKIGNKKAMFIKLLKFINKFKLKHKVAVLLVAVAIVSFSIVRAENSDYIYSNDSYIESFNMEVSKELSKDVGDGIVESNNIEDVIVTINPTLEGEEFAVYKTTVNLTLKSSDIKVKDGEKTFKTSDVEIEVLDVSPDLTTEDMALLQEESIKAIAKESASLTKKLRKELKKQDKYIEEIIKSKM